MGEPIPLRLDSSFRRLSWFPNTLVGERGGSQSSFSQTFLSFAGVWGSSCVLFHAKQNQNALSGQRFFLSSLSSCVRLSGAGSLSESSVLQVLSPGNAAAPGGI